MIVVVKCHSKQTPAEYKAKQDLTCSIYMLAGQSRLGDLHPRKKLSLSNQLGSLVHAPGVDLVPAVDVGEVSVIDYPILLFQAKVGMAFLYQRFSTSHTILNLCLSSRMCVDNLVSIE